MIIISFLYVLIVLSLLWGRFSFFKVNSGAPRLTVFLYDCAVTIQIITTLYFVISVTNIAFLFIYFSIFLYIIALIIFWWAIVTAKSLDFAFSNKVGNIITTGPFRFFRHPFYVSYILVWLSSTLLFKSPILWITLLYLIAFYILSARKEEKVILQSEYSTEYEKYTKNVGMFLPRIKNDRNKIPNADN